MTENQIPSRRQMLIDTWRMFNESSVPLTDLEVRCMDLLGELIHADVAVHKADPLFADVVSPWCKHCHQPVHRVPGGQGSTWVHTDTGAVAGSGAPR